MTVVALVVPFTIIESALVRVSVPTPDIDATVMSLAALAVPAFKVRSKPAPVTAPTPIAAPVVVPPLFVVSRLVLPSNTVAPRVMTSPLVRTVPHV